MAWALADMLDRLTRWLDDDDLGWLTHTMRCQPPGQKKLFVGSMEQPFFDDALWSVVSGRPIFRACLSSCAWFVNQEQRLREQMFRAIANVTGCDAAFRNQTSGPLPSGLYDRFRFAPKQQLMPNGVNVAHVARRLVMRVPNSGGVYPASLGGVIYPPLRPDGIYSRLFRQQLAEDCPSCARWPPDIDNPAVAAAGASNTEVFMFADPHVMGNFHSVGRIGSWSSPADVNDGSTGSSADTSTATASATPSSSSLPLPAPAVLGHVHFVPPPFRSLWTKNVIRIFYVRLHQYFVFTFRYLWERARDGTCCFLQSPSVISAAWSPPFAPS